MVRRSSCHGTIFAHAIRRPAVHDLEDAGARPTIDEPVADALVQLLPRLAVTEDVRIHEIAVVATHVHVVFRTGRKPDFSKIAQRFKGASSRLINQNAQPAIPLHWDSGYDLRSVGRRSLPAVQRYFDSQAARHRLPWVKRFSDDAKVTLEIFMRQTQLKDAG